MSTIQKLKSEIQKLKDKNKYLKSKKYIINVELEEKKDFQNMKEKL